MNSIDNELRMYLAKRNEKVWDGENFYDDERRRLIGDIERKGDEIDRLNLMIRISNDNEKNTIKSLINILDSIEWLFGVSTALTNNNLTLSIEHTWKKIRKELLRLGVTQINTKGEIFDETIHNCVDVVELEGSNENEIYDVITSGYMLRGEILRTANVIVTKRKEL